MDYPGHRPHVHIPVDVTSVPVREGYWALGLDLLLLFWCFVLFCFSALSNRFGISFCGKPSSHLQLVYMQDTGVFFCKTEELSGKQ